jgi:hypothetical protein
METVLALPRVRVLRALRWFDWASSMEITNALELGEHDLPPVLAAIGRLVEEGKLDRRGSSQPYEYRINDAGRTELKALLAKTQISDRDEKRAKGARS